MGRELFLFCEWCTDDTSFSWILWGNIIFYFLHPSFSKIRAVVEDVHYSLTCDGTPGIKLFESVYDVANNHSLCGILLWKNKKYQQTNCQPI